MLSYPPTKTSVCRYCGETVTLVRQGDGHPGGGRLHYWYSSDHDCPGARQAIALQQAEHEIVEGYLNGPG